MRRIKYLEQIQQRFEVNPIIALLGPRQCGKTTMARELTNQQSSVHYFDLENPTDLAKLKDPMLALENLEGLIVIDEIQRRPDLFPILRVLIDKSQRKQRYLILGSASRQLIMQSSESLAGRISYIELTPFILTETHNSKLNWLRGGFPLAYLADSDELCFTWLNDYIKTFLEQDIPNLGINVPAQTLRRFWMMLTHYHGNILNQADLGRSIGVSHTAIRHYLDILSGTFMIRILQPWHTNISKRQVKQPKIYFRDSGILHSLLAITNFNDLTNNPKLGASWEGFALEQIIQASQAESENCYFWATHAGAELDLLVLQGQKKIGFEIKYTSSPKLTKSMQIAMQDCKLDKLYVVFPGTEEFPLSRENIIAIGLDRFIDEA